MIRAVACDGVVWQEATAVDYLSAMWMQNCAAVIQYQQQYCRAAYCYCLRYVSWHCQMLTCVAISDVMLAMNDDDGFQKIVVAAAMT